MRRFHRYGPPRRGFTLTELLVTIALIMALMVLMIPCWKVISRSRARRAGATIVMQSLEQAKNAAITGKSDVWVIFRHSGEMKQDSLRLLKKQGTTILPLSPWQPLPPGISFHTGPATLMQEKPPGDILGAALNGGSPGREESFGAILFQRTGRIGIPLPGGNALALQLDSQSGISSGSIILSRATGRATCQ